MSLHRRTLMRVIGSTGMAAVLAGCSGSSNGTTRDEDTETTEPQPNAGSSTSTTEPQSSAESGTSTDATASTTEAGSGYDPSGGPNVVDAVPDDADHVVELTASSFEPEELTVTAGDTVAFNNADEAVHTVTAKGDAIPSDADYWSSGDYETQTAAESAFDDADGVVTGGRVYVHAFETTGTHEYYCIPHSHIQMEGTVVVEES